MPISDQMVSAYNKARTYLEDLFGVTPENYNVLMFVDPSLYDSVLLQTMKAGSPRAILSSSELEVLQQLKEDNFVANGMDLFYPSRSSKLFFPQLHSLSTINEKIMEAKFVQGLAKAMLCEQTKSRFPDTLDRLYELDSIIYNLFANNVYEFIKERNAGWVWQYFQDFTATMRLLSLYQLDNFYIPPSSIRSASLFYNYLMEIKGILSDRSKAVTNAPLFDLVLNGFGDLVINDYLSKQDNSVEISPYLKSNLGQPLALIGSTFLNAHEENISDAFESAINFQNDHELTKIWGRKETKSVTEEVREKLSNQSLIWHSFKNSYWSDLWPLRASEFDKINTYVGKIQRRGYKSFKELLIDSPLVKAHGNIKLKDREVAVMSIQEDTVGQEQLLILRNHLQAKKDTFVTPLPGLPDVIVFKKYAGMHIASYLGIVDQNRKKSYPKSPYDLPLVVRAVQVTRRKDAYQSQEREDSGKLETANYENLGKLTEPQHRAIRYLIRQREVIQ